MSLGSLPDGALVARCRSGDEQAWCELVERFSRYVYAITTQAFRLAPEDAEDVFQEVFARTYEHLHTLRSDEAIRPWIAQLARRLSVDRLRASTREPVALHDREPSDPDDVLEKLEEALSVRDALETLPDHCREILDRFFCRDESYATIGGALALPPGTIASRISRCLRRLRDTFAGREMGAGASGGR
jgi:RNA polymerase sigma-70 factor, ECF subfamily